MYDTVMNTGAAFDQTRRYRYTLWREWDTRLARVAFLMLNPSRADAVSNDRTISACLSLAIELGFGSMEVVNLFAYMTSDPNKLRRVRDPVGKGNDAYIVEASRRADATVLAWGNHGALLDRAHQVKELLRGAEATELWCFGITKLGQPRHPLYLKRSSPLVHYRTEFTPDGCCGAKL